MVDYVILTTFPEHKSGNVGDKLITHAAKELINEVKGKSEFITYFREENLNPHLDVVNNAKAVIMPGCPTRYNMYPDMFELVDNLDKINVPLIPMGSSWSSFPGDYTDCENLFFSQKTENFLKFLSNQTSYFTCRDYFTSRLLEKHGVNNTLMTGDYAWYDLDCMGKDMKRPVKIKKLVFTTPHNPLYTSQAKNLIKMLSDLFPNSQKYCSFHSVPNETDKDIGEFAKKKGFILKNFSHDVNKIDFYDDCDLHVGYRLHGNIAFLRKRIPSILLNEDGRGVAFSYTMGIDGFNAFSKRIPNSLHSKIKRNESKWINRRGNFILKRIRNKILAKSNPFVVDRIERFLKEEIENNFRRFSKISKYIDDTYENKMKPFIEQIP